MTTMKLGTSRRDDHLPPGDVDYELVDVGHLGVGDVIFMTREGFMISGRVYRADHVALVVSITLGKGASMITTLGERIRTNMLSLSSKVSRAHA